jgi:hypothetical protein
VQRRRCFSNINFFVLQYKFYLLDYTKGKKFKVCAALIEATTYARLLTG